MNVGRPVAVVKRVVADLNVARGERMNIGRVVAVVKRVFADLNHDKRTVGLIVIVPLLFMLAFGFAFQGDVRDVRVLVVNDDNGGGLGNASISDRVIANLDTATLTVDSATNESAAVAEVQNGKAYAVIVFPTNLTETVYGTAAQPPLAAQANPPGIIAINPQAKVSIRVLADKSNTEVSRAIITAVNAAVLKTADENGQSQRLSVDTTGAIYGLNARFIDFFCPGIVCLAIWNLTTLLTLQAFVGEREIGTLQRLFASPLRESELVAGYSIAYGTLGVMQAGLLLAVGVLLFNVIIVGNIILAFATIALLAIVSQALGILLSSVAHSQREAGEFMPFLMLSAVLLSGIIWPIEAIPVWLRPASYLIPTTYAVEAVRSVMMRGWGLSMIWVDIVALLVFAITFLVLAVIMLKKRE
ncbi:MAG: ABC transporter permease [Euryarchaeota archaeon]|nr:ABC transporter permease [Euryarchaeota archaeon]